MKELTLAQWWALEPGEREVVVDRLLELVPAGYRDPRAVGHTAGPLPQFIHEATGVLFHVVFGGPAVVGMSERRLARLSQVVVTEEEDMMVPVARMEEARELVPARAVTVRTALVANQPLPFGVLRKLGLDEVRLTIAGVNPVAVGALLRAVTAQHWRAPSEAEWEYALRAVEDSVGDEPAPLRPSGRLVETGLRQMGERVELCRDDWSDNLSSLPEQDAHGQGHEVLRGRGNGGRFAGWSVSSAWSEALWPGRRRLASWTTAVSFRPWVDLAG